MTVVTLLAVGGAGYAISQRSSAGAAQSAPRVITERHGGKTFTLKRSASSVLRLGNKWNWPQPKVRGGTVVLYPVNYESDPGFKEWRITRRAAGTAKITAYGRANCDGCTRRARWFSVTLKVR